VLAPGVEEVVCIVPRQLLVDQARTPAGVPFFEFVVCTFGPEGGAGVFASPLVGVSLPPPPLTLRKQQAKRVRGIPRWGFVDRGASHTSSRALGQIEVFMGGSAVCLWALNTLQRAARHKPLRQSTQERLLLGPEVNWAHHTHPWCGREITATPQRVLWHAAPSELRHRRRHRPLLTLTNPKTPLLLRGTLACRDSLACFFLCCR
jgi:hypothetical protein